MVEFFLLIASKVSQKSVQWSRKPLVFISNNIYDIKQSHRKWGTVYRNNHIVKIVAAIFFHFQFHQLIFKETSENSTQIQKKVFVTNDIFFYFSHIRRNQQNGKFLQENVLLWINVWYSNENAGIKFHYWKRCFQSMHQVFTYKCFLCCSLLSLPRISLKSHVIFRKKFAYLHPKFTSPGTTPCRHNSVINIINSKLGSRLKRLIPCPYSLGRIVFPQWTHISLLVIWIRIPTGLLVMDSQIIHVSVKIMEITLDEFRVRIVCLHRLNSASISPKSVVRA